MMKKNNLLNFKFSYNGENYILDIGELKSKVNIVIQHPLIMIIMNILKKAVFS